ncbi:MAG: DUF3179 domain-containing protein [Draconibacterium sp.]|nr:DUF3179 domain-containing protein [Draconibacterium sp.]
MNKLLLFCFAATLFFSCGEDIVDAAAADGLNVPPKTPDATQPLTADVVIFNDKLEGVEIVLVGNAKDLYIVSFLRMLDGTLLEFTSTDDELPIIMNDNEGNKWDIFGFAVEGPRKGQRLELTQSLMGYWFSFATFYPGIQIYPNSAKGIYDGETITGTNNWLVPHNEVRSGGPGKDGIPAISNPEFVSVAQSAFMEKSDFVVGFSDGTNIKAYPHDVLDWHEIVNDWIGPLDYSIIYCPLTGTATAWDRVIDGKISSFGVSGLLYNTNIVPYDRATGSNWSQLFDKAIFGEKKGVKPKTYMVLETTWQTWKKLYPGSKIMNFNTGYNRNYGSYPYGDYREDSNIIFPVKYLDPRLHAKERVHAVIINGKARVYRFEEFTGN